MRRFLLAAVLAGAAFATGSPAVAEPHCLTVTSDESVVALCYEYVCVDICAPEHHVDPQCQVRTNPPSILLEALCARVDEMYVVV